MSTPLIISPSKPKWGTPTKFLQAALEAAPSLSGDAAKHRSSYEKNIERVLNQSNVEWKEALVAVAWPIDYGPANREFFAAMPTVYPLQGQHRLAVFMFALSGRMGLDSRRAGALGGINLLEEEGGGSRETVEALADKLLAKTAAVIVNLYDCPTPTEAQCVGLEQHARERETKYPTISSSATLSAPWIKQFWNPHIEECIERVDDRLRLVGGELWRKHMACSPHGLSPADRKEARAKAKAMQGLHLRALQEDMRSVGATTSKPSMAIFYMATALHPERAVIIGIHRYFKNHSNFAHPKSGGLQEKVCLLTFACLVVDRCVCKESGSTGEVARVQALLTACPTERKALRQLLRNHPERIFDPGTKKTFFDDRQITSLTERVGTNQDCDDQVSSKVARYTVLVEGLGDEDGRESVISRQVARAIGLIDDSDVVLSPKVTVTMKEGLEPTVKKSRRSASENKEEEEGGVPKGVSFQQLGEEQEQEQKENAGVGGEKELEAELEEEDAGGSGEEELEDAGGVSFQQWGEEEEEQEWQEEELEDPGVGATLNYRDNAQNGDIGASTRANKGLNGNTVTTFLDSDDDEETVEAIRSSSSAKKGGTDQDSGDKENARGMEVGRPRGSAESRGGDKKRKRKVLLSSSDDESSSSDSDSSPSASESKAAGRSGAGGSGGGSSRAEAATTPRVANCHPPTFSTPATNFATLQPPSVTPEISSSSNGSEEETEAAKERKILSAIERARRKSDNYPNEGKISAFFQDDLGSRFFKNVSIAARKSAIGKDSNAYVFTPQVVAMFKGGLKISEAMLDIKALAQHMYCPGDGPGSLVDLVKQQCNPRTQYPNVAVDIWKSTVDDSNKSGTRRGRGARRG